MKPSSIRLQAQILTPNPFVLRLLSSGGRDRDKMSKMRLAMPQYYLEAG